MKRFLWIFRNSEVRKEQKTMRIYAEKGRQARMESGYFWSYGCQLFKMRQIQGFLEEAH